jgi:spore germination protein KB
VFPLLDQPLTRPQAVAILMMFCFGSSAVVGVSTGVGQDAWAALTLSIAFTVPVFWIYSRIISLNPGMGFFEVAELLLGKVIGKVVTALMSWYALHLCALVLRNFSEFIQISALLETPQLAVLLIMGVTVYALARNGCKALGKWSLATMPIVLGIVAVTVLFSAPVMNPLNFLPVFEHPLGDILKSAFQSFSFPFAETVLFLGIADFVRPSDSPGKIYFFSFLFTALVLLLIVCRNLMILGPAVVSVEYFPSYSAVRIISLGDFISRIEGSISINFMLAGVTKIALCLIVASRGIASLFGIRDWRTLVAPAGLMAVALAQILYKSTMEMFAFIDYYGLYAILFELAIPLLLWTVSELRSRKQRQGACSAGDPGDAAGCARTGD